jgi:hypothetical protein
MSGYLRQMAIYEGADKLRLEFVIFAPAWSVGFSFALGFPRRCFSSGSRPDLAYVNAREDAITLVCRSG